MKTFTGDKLVQRGMKAAVVSGVGVLAVSAGMHISHGGPAKAESTEHSISYLNEDEMETGIEVGENQTPEQIVQTVNGNRLSGQALIDAENFVNNEGTVTVKLTNGTEQHYLNMNQTVEAPIMSDQQIADVNSGKI